MLSPVLPAPEDAAALESEHRDIDALLGAFFQSAAGGALAEALDSISRFDDALRVHTRAEEAVFPETALDAAGSDSAASAAGSRRPSGLAPAAGESETETLFRELRLEHVQIRELSGMIRRVLSESGDLQAATGLAGGLARRWDAHIAREEREWLRPAPPAGLAGP